MLKLDGIQYPYLVFASHCEHCLCSRSDLTLFLTSDSTHPLLTSNYSFRLFVLLHILLAIFISYTFSLFADISFSLSPISRPVSSLHRLHPEDVPFDSLESSSPLLPSPRQSQSPSSRCGPVQGSSAAWTPAGWRSRLLEVAGELVYCRDLAAQLVHLRSLRKAAFQNQLAGRLRDAAPLTATALDAGSGSGAGRDSVECVVEPATTPAAPITPAQSLAHQPLFTACAYSELARLLATYSFSREIRSLLQMAFLGLELAEVRTIFCLSHLYTFTMPSA
ncbi:unnamed protein product [Protopolystoma xenopodis]|uniref:Uncharacterized protein n=1 Tax=Protopolystoma xenopodis TaxID=117903 RepID=A0A3S5CQB2_9PLAT|nr:unnamed protein product [Protopolystoma xenopodis]